LLGPSPISPRYFARVSWLPKNCGPVAPLSSKGI
jgi:hypothetical protein